MESSVLSALGDLVEAWARLGTGAESLQVVPAAFIAAQHYPRLDPAQPALIVELEGAEQAERLCRTLSAAYGPDWEVTIIEGGTGRTVRLTDLPAASRDAASGAVWIPPLPRAAAYEALQDLAAHLRSPEGCPWDRELTWAKLRGTLLEETYELLAALDADDAPKVAEELGDLLVQIAMQTQIAAEEGRFRLPDVIAGIVEKLVRRHPHVFGDAVVSGTGEVLANWEAIKRAERLSNGGERSPLSGIPPGLPALAQADAYLERMSRLEAARAPAEPWAPLASLPPDAEVSPRLVGQVLFGMVAWARAHGVDAESALRQANGEFAALVREMYADNTQGRA